MALGSTQPLTEMSTIVFPEGKGGRCVRLTTLPLPCAVVTKSGNLNFLEPSGPVQACNGDCFTFLSTHSTATFLVFYIYFTILQQFSGTHALLYSYYNP